MVDCCMVDFLAVWQLFFSRLSITTNSWSNRQISQIAKFNPWGFFFIMSDSAAENAEKAEEQELPEEVDTAKLLETAAAIQEDEDLANIVTAEEYLMCKDVVLLEYEKQMFLDQVQADGLLVCAK